MTTLRILERGDRRVTIRFREAGIRRLVNSSHGNPRFRIRCHILGESTPDDSYRDLITMSDVADAFSITNGWKGKTIRDASVVLSRAGRIRYLTYLDGDN